MKKIFSLLLILVSLNTQGQLVINNTTPYDTPTYLTDNILLGGGIGAANFSFIGDSNQIGFFNAINSNLGIDSGIVLSSGNIFDLLGPNAIGSTSTIFSGAGDPTLDAVIFPDPTNDAAVLEFDFIPTSDTISFKYIFGSEEYLEFVNSYNDAFGFFLTGPNPAGGNYIDQNLAIVPGTTNTPVTINNVNNAVNSNYYIDNGDGSTAPQNTDSTVIEFDGFTTPLTASAAVNCGDTYHIKLVVADAVDNSWDSGVFLEAGSFSATEPGAVSIEIITTDVICNGDSSGTANISCVQGITPPYTVNWNSQDPTALSAGNYTLEITDGNGILSVHSYSIYENPEILQVLSYNGGVLNSSVSGGTPTYTYTWLFNNSVVGNSMNYSPTLNGDYICIIEDINGCTNTSDIMNVNDLTTGLNEQNTFLTSYPNPFTKKTIIQLENAKYIVTNISLFNYLGEKEIINAKIKNNSIVVERGYLPKGTYILCIYTDNLILKSKLNIN